MPTQTVLVSPFQSPASGRLPTAAVQGALPARGAVDDPVDLGMLSLALAQGLLRHDELPPAQQQALLEASLSSLASSETSMKADLNVLLAMLQDSSNKAAAQSRIAAYLGQLLSARLKEQAAEEMMDAAADRYEAGVLAAGAQMAQGGASTVITGAQGKLASSASQSAQEAQAHKAKLNDVEFHKSNAATLQKKVEGLNQAGQNVSQHELDAAQRELNDAKANVEATLESLKRKSVGAVELDLMQAKSASEHASARSGQWGGVNDALKGVVHGSTDVVAARARREADEADAVSSRKKGAAEQSEASAATDRQLSETWNGVMKEAREAARALQDSDHRTLQAIVS